MAVPTRIPPLQFDPKMSLKYFLLVLVAVVVLATPSFGDYPKPPPHEHIPPTYKPPKGGENPPMGMPPMGGEKPWPQIGEPPKGGEKPLPEHKLPMPAPMGREKPPMGMPPKRGEKPLPEHKPPMGAPMGGEKPPAGMPPKGEEKPPSHGHYPGHILMENVQDLKKPPRKVMPPMGGPSKKPYGLHKPPHMPKSPPHSL